MTPTMIKIMKIKYKYFLQLCSISAALACLSLLPMPAFATQYALPPANNALIGDVSYSSAWYGENIVTIGQRNNVGVNAMLDANPGINEKAFVPAGTSVKVPSKFLLPAFPRRGIVINLAEMRMYYYPEGSNTVMTFPVGIGRVGKTVPTGNTIIASKTVNPTWTPPEDIRVFNREQGIELPYAMGPGPDNPLGPYAIYLGFQTYLIHSTIFPESIGRRASFGCIRMNESDIKQFFPLVQRGTPVIIVDMPNKIGWEGNRLFLETHPPLEEHNDDSVASVTRSIESSIPKNAVAIVNWQAVAYLAEQRDGVPHEIGFRAR